MLYIYTHTCIITLGALVCGRLRKSKFHVFNLTHLYCRLPHDGDKVGIATSINTGTNKQTPIMVEC